MTGWAAYSQHVQTAEKIALDSPELNSNPLPSGSRPQRSRTLTARGDVYAKEMHAEQTQKKSRKKAPPPTVVSADRSFSDIERDEIDEDEEANLPSDDSDHYRRIRESGAYTSVAVTPAPARSKPLVRRAAALSAPAQFEDTTPRHEPPSSAEPTSRKPLVRRAVPQHLDSEPGDAERRTHAAVGKAVQPRGFSGHDIGNSQPPSAPLGRLAKAPLPPARLGDAPVHAPKRNHDSDADDPEEDLEDTPAPRKRARNERPVARKLEVLERSVCNLAIADFKAMIATDDPFPHYETTESMAGTALHRAAIAKDFKVGDRKLYEYLTDLITQRASETRGKIRDKILPLVEIKYGFNNGGTVKAARENRTLVKGLLKENRMVYQDPSAKKGMYEHPILQASINACWFSGHDDGGIAFASYFDPISLETIALVFTVVQFCIGQWQTGARNSEVSFTFKVHRPIFERHLQALKDLKNSGPACATAVGHLQERLLSRARRAAGAVALERKHVPILRAEDFSSFLAEQQARVTSEEEVDEETGDIDDEE